MDGYVQDFFFLNRCFTQWAGLWLPEDKSTVNYKVYRVFHTIAVLCVIILNPAAVIIGIIQNIYDFPVLIELLNVGFTIFLSGLKCAFWLNNGKNIKKIMYDLESEAYHYEKIDDFNPGFLTKKAKKIGKKYSMVFFCLTQLTLGFIYLPSITLSFWYYINDLPITNITTFQKLPYYTYVPFSYDTPLEYMFVCIFQSIPCYLDCLCLVSVDTLFMNILNFIGTHMLILQGAFKTIRRRCLKKIKGLTFTKDGLYNSIELEEAMMVEMKKSIKHLQMLIKSCNNLEESFKYVSLGQALGTLYLLCSSLLMISRTPLLSEQFGIEILYLFGINFQLGLYCWFGNEVTLKAMNVPSALWESDWHETRKSYKTFMLLTMIRLKKPIYLTVGNFAPLILETHFAVLKGSYSYYTVLKSMSK